MHSVTRWTEGQTDDVRAVRSADMGKYRREARKRKSKENHRKAKEGIKEKYSAVTHNEQSSDRAATPNNVTTQPLQPQK